MYYPENPLHRAVIADARRHGNGWLRRLCEVALRSDLLTRWEVGFAADLGRRLAEQRHRLKLSPKQREMLGRIQGTLKFEGLL